MNLHKQKIRDCFNKAFLSYDKYSNIQKLAGEKLINFIKSYYFNDIIDLGCGTGFVTELLAHAFKHQNFYAIDISDKLLLTAKERLKFYNINTANIDFENFCFKPILFDLVFSNMALQWSLNIHKLLSNIYHNLNENGIVAFSLPVEGTFSELIYFLKNKFYTEDQIKQILSSAKFKIINYSSEKIILKFASVIDALKSIKSVGANYVFNSDQPRKFFKYSKISHRKFFLTYHIAYFIVGKS